MNVSKLRRPARAVLTLATILFGLALIPAGLLAPMSVMALDGGVGAPAALFVALVLGFPIAILVSIPGSWLCYRGGAYRAAMWLSLLPLINVAGVSAMFALMR